MEYIELMIMAFDVDWVPRISKIYFCDILINITLSPCRDFTKYISNKKIL